MKSIFIITFLLNISSIYSFKHYKYYNIKAVKGCPFKNNKCILNKNPPNTKKDYIITYPSYKDKVNNYNPRKVDWSSVISGCHAACNFDKRLCNFYIRASAHDSLSISEGYGGPDGSMLITEDELKRPENNYDNFAYKLSKNALALAKRFDTSVADIIAVCGAYSVKYLGGINIIQSNQANPFLVGRIDSTTPNPANQLVPENANTTDFNNFAIKYGFSLEEFSALLGSHALLDEKNCLNKDRTTLCNPLEKPCKDISMFTWDNSYFQDICSKNITIKFNSAPNEFIKTKKQLIKNELCKFTSEYFKNDVKKDLALELNLDIEQILLQDNVQELNDIIVEQDIQIIKSIDVTHFENSIINEWLYTTNDAWLGLACQNKLEANNYNLELSNSLNKFKTSKTKWELVYMKAYKKMINNNVRWFNLKKNGFSITGNECKSGYKLYNNIKLCKTAFLPDETFYN